MVKPGFKAHQPMVMAAEVEVDVETGVVKPIRLVTGTFPGRMINPGVVRGQAVGAAAQALGMALWEELRYDEQTSSYLSDGFTDYRIPRALDMPEIEMPVPRGGRREQPSPRRAALWGSRCR